ncbi:MAG: response regulator, partial [Bacteroidales bacterium]|nr:response regulator [Bacteroidales bacterium]
QKNIEILLQLVNEIMDFRKLETGHAQLMAQEINLGVFVKEISDGFLSYASNKNIQFITQCDDDCFIWADNDKLSKIIYNILSNAFKFTPIEGRILVNVSSSSIAPNPAFLNKHTISSGNRLLTDYVEVMIEDSGIGISSDSIVDIFERYYQTDNASQHLGSGIGLALAKQLILLHKADVVVSSQKNKGTRFSIRFAKGNSHLTSNEMLISNNEFPQTKYELKNEIDGIQTSINKEENFGGHLHILVIEDNPDLRTYLKDIFSLNYKVFTAKDGQEGYDMALEYMPDIILSDVMMPRMNGIELCNKLKTDVNTSHIPIVLLTARSSVEHQQEGLQTGADAYIPKPFDESILKMQIDNLVSTRLKIIQKAQNSNSITSKELTTNQIDNNFINNTNEIIIRELSNNDFRLEDLAKEIGMSYKSFQRKLKAITGNTPGEFTRTIRLNAASELLLTTKLSISEIAFKTGFYDVSHFGKLFKERFEMSASHYRNKHS